MAKTREVESVSSGSSNSSSSASTSASASSADSSSSSSSARRGRSGAPSRAAPSLTSSRDDSAKKQIHGTFSPTASVGGLRAATVRRRSLVGYVPSSSSALGKRNASKSAHITESELPPVVHGRFLMVIHDEELFP